MCIKKLLFLESIEAYNYSLLNFCLLTKQLQEHVSIFKKGSISIITSYNEIAAASHFHKFKTM